MTDEEAQPQRTERGSVNDLVERLAAWVVQQPEYPYLFLADRHRRKRAASIVSHRLFLLPVQPPETDYAARKEQRAYAKAANRSYGQLRERISRRGARLRANAEKQRRRYRRLSMQRMFELAEREDEQRMQLAEEEAHAMDLARDLRLAMEAEEVTHGDSDERAEEQAPGGDDA